MKNKYQEAIEMIKQCECKDCECECLKSLQELVDKTNWISCLDRLPENNHSVLVYLKSTSGEGCVYGIGKYEDEEFWFLSQNVPNRLGYPNLQWKVIAWMPLPDAYKENEE